ncbi:MAG: bifunctional diguanylate cyclase/phosphodiesterase [Lachnospiraceae bacterium]|nr:bifunctional diguanylate cyclase/phosphodiesterase [Lachnospiraceae bacterium]
MHKLSEELFQNAMNMSDTIVFQYDYEDDSIHFSENVERYIPIALNVNQFTADIEIRGKVYPKDAEKAISFFTIPPERDKVKMEYLRFIDMTGEFYWYQLKGRAETTEDGSRQFYGTMTYVEDEDKKQIDEEGKKDPITNLLSRISFMEQVDEYLSEVPDNVLPSLLVIDIDDFTEWTELNGSIGAEGVLVEVARILKRTFRGSDIIGRIENDRFAVFMKGVRYTGILVERSIHVIKSVQDVWDDLSQDTKLTVSIGIVYTKGGDIDAGEIYNRGLIALKDAKHNKDKFTLYDELMERVEQVPDPILSTKEMELVTNILDPVSAYAYAVDEEYTVIFQNDKLAERYGEAFGHYCYHVYKNYSSPCPDCPISQMSKNLGTVDGEVYSPSLRSALPFRATKITLRNGKNIYVLSSIREDVEKQDQALRESEDRIRNAMVYMLNLIWDVDLTRNTCIRMKEKNLKSVMDMRISNYKNLREYYMENVVYPEDRGEFFEATDPRYLRAVRKQGVSLLAREVRLLTVDDEYKWYNIYSVFLDEQTGRTMIICLDVNEYKKHRLEEMETRVRHEILRQKSEITKEMALTNERHENVNEMVGILVYEYNVGETDHYLSPMFDDVFPVNRRMLNNEWSLINSLRCHSDDRENFDQFKEDIKRGINSKVTVRLYNRYKVAVWYTIIVQALLGMDSKPVRYLWTFQNVDSEMRIKREMEYRTEYDSLTGLYNSEAFYQKVEELIYLWEDKKAAIISIDIDRFRLINDRHGIEAGNKCIQRVGKAIKQCLPKECIAKRYQADVFSVLLTYESDKDFIDFMSRLTAVVRDDDEMAAPVSLVFGIYKISDKGLPIRLMCDRARAVKKQIKGSMISNYAVYDDEIRLKLREQKEIEDEMQMALVNNEFVMYLQPQINIKDNTLYGAEALVRWEHPTKGIMLPGQFIPLFENNGFITNLDRYMWERACAYIKQLRKKGYRIPISVNVSRLNIGTIDITSTLDGLTKKYGIDKELLEVEITENFFLDDARGLFGEMEELRNRGYMVLMDDFGSGYSSLNMLRNAPVDIIKIDRFFLDEIMATDRGKIIVEASVRMAKQLGLRVIAEGVETKEQLDFLRNIDCDIAQGFYYSKPVSTEEFERLLKERWPLEQVNEVQEKGL